MTEKLTMTKTQLQEVMLEQWVNDGTIFTGELVPWKILDNTYEWKEDSKMYSWAKEILAKSR